MRWGVARSLVLAGTKAAVVEFFEHGSVGSYYGTWFRKWRKPTIGRPVAQVDMGFKSGEIQIVDQYRNRV